jgi:hypothetical protein
MTFRIFDHVLANHTWSAAGLLCIAQAPEAASCAMPSPSRDGLAACPARAVRRVGRRDAPRREAIDREPVSPAG